MKTTTKFFFTIRSLQEGKKQASSRRPPWQAMKSGFHGDNVTIVGWMLPLLMGKNTPGLQECDRITAHLVGIYCLVAGLFHVFARNRNLRWLFQSPEAREANDVRTRPDSGCTISRNRTHQHPICFEHSSWKPCFYCFQQFQFCVGIWWGRVGLPRVFFADAGDTPRSQAVKAGLSWWRVGGRFVHYDWVLVN